MEPDLQLLFDVDTTIPDITFDFTFDTPLPPPVVNPQFGEPSLGLDATASVSGSPLLGDDVSSLSQSPGKPTLLYAPPSPVSGTSEDDAAAAAPSSKKVETNLASAAVAGCWVAVWGRGEGQGGGALAEFPRFFAPCPHAVAERAASARRSVARSEPRAATTMTTMRTRARTRPTFLRPTQPRRRSSSLCRQRTAAPTPLTLCVALLPPLPFAASSPSCRQTKAQLATMTCEDLDAYTLQVQAHHALSEQEKAYLKKYRRQIRNRECAQNMRARKRQYTETLEGTIDGLQHKLKEAQERAARAEKERDALQERARYLEGVLRSRSVPFDEGQRASSRRGAPLVAAGTLFAVVFSLGLFLGPLVAPAGQPMPASLASSGGGGAGSSSGTGRELLVKEADLLAQAALEERQSVTTSPMQRLVRAAASSQAAKAAPNEPKRIAIVEQGPVAVAGTQLQERSDKSALMVSPMVRQHSVPSAFDAKFDRPDTEYMYCPAVHSMFSTHKSAADSADHGDEFPSRVSLIIPGDAFNDSQLFQHMSPQPPLVEISCSVVDIWPVWPEGTSPGVAP